MPSHWIFWWTPFVPFLLCLQLRTCRWTPCLLSVESREVTIIGNMWGSHGNFLGISSRAVDLTMRPYDQWLTQRMDKYHVTVFYQIRFKIFIWVYDIIQLSPLLECDPTVCLPEKIKVDRGWPNFSRGDKPSGHTPTRVIIGILYRIFLHQTPSNRIPVTLRKYSI
jgi:hypothetical protein